MQPTQLLSTGKFPITRREFLRQSALAAAAVSLLPASAYGRRLSPNDKLNLGVIGVAHRGGADLAAVSSENVAALCDVDDRYLGAAAKRYSRAKTYHDFRRLIDQRDLDAIVVGTPDHTHAVATAAALRSGRDVYCEKPLTHTVAEARVITELTRTYRRVTQIGTQIHAGDNYRRVVELIQTGAIGPVHQVHVWVAVSYGNMPQPPKTASVPSDLHYDLWVGPVPYRPYSPEYLPQTWRNWWVFGGGTMADFGCHYMDLPFWALGLRYPLTIEPVDGPPVDAEETPPWLIVRYQFPARGGQPPVQMTWYHGDKYPSLLTADQHERWGSGVLFIGDNGQLLADYTRHQLLPEEKFADFVPPQPFIPKSIGHHREWIQACKTRGATTCNFGYSGPLTETALLGNVAYRVGRKLEWNARHLRTPNCPEAERYIRYDYRRGWRL